MMFLTKDKKHVYFFVFQFISLPYLYQQCVLNVPSGDHHLYSPSNLSAYIIFGGVTLCMYVCMRLYLSCTNNVPLTDRFYTNVCTLHSNYHPCTNNVAITDRFHPTLCTLHLTYLSCTNYVPVIDRFHSTICTRHPVDHPYTNNVPITDRFYAILCIHHVVWNIHHLVAFLCNLSVVRLPILVPTMFL